MSSHDVQTKKRTPRFRQSSETVPSMCLTTRDEAILKQLAIHRFLRSSRIADLVGGSSQQVLRRLQLLFHHGYVDRPRSQIDRFHVGGSKPMAYGLASRGASYLRRAYDVPFERMHWSRKRDAAGRLFLDHALLISDIATRLDLDCRNSTPLRWLDPHDLDRPEQVEPSRWSVTLPITGSLTVIPDRIFRIQNEDETVLYFLEADCGTMPVTRKNLEQSSIQRKLLTYAATWEQGLHRQFFGENRFRVLFVTTDSVRCQNMKEAAKSLPKGRGLFLFAEKDELNSSESILTHRWQNASASERSSILGS